MRSKLTAKIVEHLSCPGDRRLQVWDATLPGFGLRVTPHGRKTWNVICRQGKRQRRITLGTYPVISLADARERAATLLRGIADGKLPDTLIPETKLHGPTVRDAIEQFIRLYAKPRNRCWKQQQRHLENEVGKPHGTKELASIKRSDVTAILDKMVARGAALHANRVLCDIRKFFNWCLERGLVENSPVLGLRPPSKERPRERVLNDEELKAIWKATDEDGYPFGTAVKLLILTGQRRGEVTCMTWDEIDLAKAIWTIPADRSKNGRPHEVPLSEQALAVIRSVPRIDEEKMLFSTNGKRPVSGISKFKRRLDDASKITGWRLHDLRRTCASGMARLRVSPHVIEKVLNHLTGQISGLAAVYNRHGYAQEKREALTIWGSHVASLCSGISDVCSSQAA